MKTTLLALMILVSASFAQAKTDSSRAQADLLTLGMMIDVTSGQIKDLASDVADLQAEYSHLGSFQWGAKMQLGQENCLNINSVVEANAIMLEATLEQIKPELNDIQEMQNQTAVAKFKSLISAVNILGDAKKSCKNPTKSSQYVRQASAIFTDVNSYFHKIIPTKY